MMQKKLQLIFLKFFLKFLCLFFPCLLCLAASLPWQKLAPGLEYANMNLLGFTGKGIHVFRIDLNYFHLQSIFTQQQNQLMTIASLVKKQKAVIGVNGGFFSPDLKPLGLRINQGQIKNPLKNTSWWGIFYIQDKKAYVTTPNNFRANKNINFAVQSGPRLVVNGEISSLKPGVANRTALGITQDGKIILLATNHFPLTTQELAEFLVKPLSQGGLGCINALNLDGGSSTQLYADVGNFSLNIPSFAVVTDAVLVLPNHSVIE